MVFKKGGGRQKEEIWKWEGETIEKVKRFKYLGFTLKNNGSAAVHIREVAKKGIIAMKEIWSIGERKFSDDFKIRMMII